MVAASQYRLHGASHARQLGATARCWVTTDVVSSQQAIARWSTYAAQALVQGRVRVLMLAAARTWALAPVLVAATPVQPAPSLAMPAQWILDVLEPLSASVLRQGAQLVAPVYEVPLPEAQPVQDAEPEDPMAPAVARATRSCLHA